MNDLNILIKAKLDEVASTANIDEQIKKISQKLSTINLEIKINDTVLKTLQDFSQSMKNMQSIINEQNKIIQTNVEIIREQDGTIKTVQTDILKSGEMIQKTTTEINKQNEALNQNRDAFRQEAESIKLNINSMNDLIRIQEKYNNEKLKSITNTYKEGIVTNIKTTYPDSTNTNSTTIIDIQKQIDFISKLETELNRLRNNFNTIFKDIPEAQSYLEKLNQEYNQFSRELNNYKNNNNTLTNDDIQNFNKRLEAFKQYTTEYKKDINDMINASKEFQNQLNFIDRLQLKADKGYYGLLNSVGNVENPQVKQYLEDLNNEYLNLTSELIKFTEQSNVLTEEDKRNLNNRLSNFNQFVNNYKNQINEIINSEKKQQLYEEQYDKWWQKQLKAREVQQQEIVNKLEQSLSKSIPVDNINLTNSDNYQRIISAYNEINQQIEIYKDKENILTKEVVNDIEKRISALKSEYNQLLANEKKQEQEQIRLANLGTKQNIAYTGYSNEDLKQYVSNLYGATAQITKFYGEQKTANGIVNSAKVAIQQLNGTYKEFIITVDSASQSVYQSAEVIKNAAGKDMDLVGQLKVAFERFPVWIVASTAVMGLIHQVQAGIQTLNDLNKAQTNIQMITDATTEQTAQWTKSLSNLSSQLHDTTTNVMSASEEFLRAGHNIQETQQLIEASTLMSKISGQAQGETAQELIAIQNAYQMSAKQVMDVVDKLTTVDNATATSTKELGIALEHTAATAQNAGVSFDKLVSYIATLSSVTRRSASTIGDSMRSIFARMESIREGKNFDPEGQPLNNVEKALNRVGIALRETDNTFRNISDVFDELAAKWNKLNDVEKNEIATAVAGVYQREMFLTLMQHYNETLDLQVKMTDSAGSALKRYQDYAQSTEAHLNDLTNAIQRMWMQILKSSDINNAISMMTNLVNAISAVVTHLGAIPTVIGISLPILLSFNKVVYGAFSKEVITAVSTFVKNVRAIPAATAIAEAGVNLLTNSFKSLRIIVAGLAKEFLPFLLLASVSYVIGYIIDKINQARQEQAELDKQNKQMASDYQANSAKIDSLVAEYDILKNKTSLSADEHQRLIDVQNELNKLMPALTEKVDAQGNAHLKNTDAIKKEIEYAQQLAQIENQKKVTNVTNDLTSIFNNIEKLQNQIKKLQQQANEDKSAYEYNKKIGNNYVATIYLQDYLKDEQKLIQAQQQLNNELNKVPSVLKTAASAYMQLVDTHHQLTQADQDYINSLINQNAASLKTTEQGKNFYDSLTRQIDGIIKVENSLSGMTEAQLKDNNVRQQAIRTLEAYGISVNNASNLVDQMINYSKNLSNTAQEEISDLGMLNNAVNKLSNGYSLTHDEIKKLVAKYPDLANALTTENGLTNINIQALKDKQKAEADSANTMIKALEAEVQKQKEALAAKLPMYAKEIKAIKNVADARALATSIADKAMEQRYKDLNNLPDTALIPDNRLRMMLKSPYYQNVAKQATNAVNEIGRLLSEINSLQAEVSKVGVSPSSPVSPSSRGYFPSGHFPSGSGNSRSKGSSSNNSYVTPVEPYVIDEFSHKMAELDLQLQQSEQRMANYEKTSKEYTNEIKVQNDLLEKEKSLIIGQINSLTLSNQALMKQINALKQHNSLTNDQQKQLNDLLKTYDDNTKSIEEYKSKIVDLNKTIERNNAEIRQNWLDVAQTVADQVVEAYKAALEKQKQLELKAKDDELSIIENNYNKLIDSINKEMDAEDKRHQQVIDALDEELQKYQDIIEVKLKIIDQEANQRDYNNQLAELNQQQSDIQRQINVLSLDDSIEAQARLADLKKQESDIEKQIEDLKYKHETDLRKQNLRDIEAAYKKQIDEKKKAENEMYKANKDRIDAEKKLADQQFEEDKSRIEKEKQLIEAHYNNIINDTKAMEDMRQKIIEGKGAEILNTLQGYLNTFNNAMSDSIKQNGEDLLGLIGVIQQVQSAQTGLSSLGSPPNISNGNTGNSVQTPIATISRSGYVYDDTGSAIISSRILGNILGVSVEWDKNNGMVIIGGKPFFPSMIDASGTSYVPIRTVAVALGHRVEFDNNTGNISIFDTGGYTGNFSNGKLAILHEKELVLNKDDTYNFLKAVNITRSLKDFLNSIKFPIKNYSIPPNVSTSQQSVYNSYYIDINIDKLNGDKNGAEILVSEFIKGLNKKGVNFG